MRLNKLFQSALKWTFLIQLFILIINLIYQPIFLNSYGKVNFGIWNVGLSLITYVSLLNFGIPTALTVIVSNSNSKIEYINYFLLSLLTLFLASLFLLILISHNDGWLFSYLVDFAFNDLSSDEYENAVQIFRFTIFLFLFRLPFFVGQAALLGLQKIQLSRLYDLLISFVTLLSLLLAVNLSLNLTQLSILTGFLSFLVLLIATFHVLFISNFKLILINEWVINLNGVRVFVTSSFGFFLLGLPVVLGWSVDTIILSKYAGASEVADFAFVTRLFSIPFQLIIMVTSILFPMYANAFARNEFIWLQKIYSRFNFVSSIYAGLIWISIMFLGQDIIALWTQGSRINVNSWFLFYYSIYIYTLSTINIQSSILSSLNKTYILFVFSVLELIIHIGLSILLVEKFGIVGISIALAASSFFIPYLILPILLRKHTNLLMVFDWKLSSTNFIYLIAVSFFYQFFLIHTRILMDYSFIFCLLFISIFFAINYYIYKRKKKVF